MISGIIVAHACYLKGHTPQTLLSEEADKINAVVDLHLVSVWE